MKDLKPLQETFADFGYTTVVETELGVSMVREDIKQCLIILKEYDEEQVYFSSELREPLEKEYNFANKGTICIFLSHDPSTTIDEIEADVYYALKVHESHIDCIPHRKEDITITFKPIHTNSDFNESVISTEIAYVINPFQEMNGIMNQDFYLYLANAQDGDVVKYPMILDGMSLSWFRYVAGKQFNVVHEKA